MPYNYNYYNRPKKENRNNRADHQRGHRMEFERNRKKIIAANNICAICGQPVDKRLKYPHPMSATVDHIIPISKGGHPTDIDNLQLAHFYCNRQKGDKMPGEQNNKKPDAVTVLQTGNRDLPLSMNWEAYTGNNQDALMEEVAEIESKGRHLYFDGIH